MRALLIGGAGYIGSATTRILSQEGDEVTVLDNFDRAIHPRGWEPDDFPGLRDAEVVEGDALDLETIRPLIERCDVVFLMASLTGTGESMKQVRRYCHLNSQVAAALCEALATAANRPSRVVLASTRGVYGEGPHLCADDGVVFPRPRDPFDLSEGRFDVLCPCCANPVRSLPSKEPEKVFPASIYGATKLAQEHIVEIQCRALRIPLTILRYQNVYGPEQSALSSHTGILTYFIRNAMEQKPIRLFEDGAIVRDFTYISDVARANALAAASSTNDFKVINIGTGVPLTLLDAAKAIVAACNSRSSIEITGQFRVGDVRSACADVNRMQTELMMPPPTPLRDGIAVMRDSYRRGGSVVAPVIL